MTVTKTPIEVCQRSRRLAKGQCPRRVSRRQLFTVFNCPFRHISSDRKTADVALQKCTYKTYLILQCVEIHALQA